MEGSYKLPLSSAVREMSLASVSTMLMLPSTPLHSMHLQTAQLVHSRIGYPWF
jgi:hypothetical protein